MISEDQIISIVDRYLSGQGDERVRVISEILSRADDADWSLVPLRVVIVLRDRHLFEEAAEAADLILAKGDVSEAVAFDLCWNACIGGHPGRVIEHLRHAFARDGLNGDQMLFLAVQHVRLGHYDEAENVVAAVATRFSHLQQEVEIHRQFFDFYKNYGPNVAWAMIGDVKRRFPSATIEALEQKIRQSLEEGRPYLLLRLGDGEGSVMRVNPHDTARYKLYYSANQKEFLKIWFEDEAVGSSLRFDQVINDFNDVIQCADAIGGIYDAALAHEYRLGSRRGIAWVVNTMRKVLCLAEHDPEWASRTSIHHLGLHYDLLLSGTLARLLQGRAHVGVVSCQGELPAALKRTYDIGEVEFYKVPGEQIHRDTLGASAVEGAHWPARFFELCDTFDRSGDRRGQLFLVAAGMLGKIYASKLKAAGAVVIDIGAVADLWMGKITRTFPHLPAEVALRLDPDESLTVVQAGSVPDIQIGRYAQSSDGALIIFEPNPEQRDMLRTHLAEQGMHATFVHKCLSNSSGRHHLHVAKSLGCSSLLEPNDDVLSRYSVGPAFRTVHSIDVDCVRYDELLSAGQVPVPDVLVLSAQGSDCEALVGFGDALQSCLGVKVRTYMYEVYKNQKVMTDIVRHLERFGLALRRMVPNNNFDGDIVEVDAWFTCGLQRLPSLTEVQKTKLKTLEHAWNLEPQHAMFRAEHFQ